MQGQVPHGVCNAFGKLACVHAGPHMHAHAPLAPFIHYPCGSLRSWSVQQAAKRGS